MKRILSVAMGLILMIVVVAGSVACTKASSEPEAKKGVSVTCDDFMKQKHINREVSAAVGDSLTVTLCSNPTTGFQWESAKIGDQTLIEQIDQKFVLPEREPTPPPGTPGKEVWTFKALKKGTTEISMEYSRPWQGGEKGEWTFVLTVVIKQPTN